MERDPNDKSYECLARALMDSQDCLNVIAKWSQSFPGVCSVYGERLMFNVRIINRELRILSEPPPEQLELPLDKTH